MVCMCIFCIYLRQLFGVSDKNSKYQIKHFCYQSLAHIVKPTHHYNQYNFIDFIQNNDHRPLEYINIYKKC